MARAEGFDPIAASNARVLILGTLPSQVSLQRREYYAQPQNKFWRIMGELFGAFPELSYAARTGTLVKKRVAVWDVCLAAHRPGSSDASIQKPEPNDFAGFFASHRDISLICFNGAKAATLYEALVLPRLTEAERQIQRQVLASTSAANAAVPYRQKLSQWLIVKGECET